jgi:signal transduction histidine kinase
LTIPAYTPPAVPDLPRVGAGPVPIVDGTPQSWRDPIDRVFSQLRATPRVIQLLLDAAGIGFTVLAFANTSIPADFVFHLVFVVLTIHAFLFGLRGTLIRIGIASLPLLAYANAEALGLTLAPMELAEWPLMFVIAVIVAWMADRRETTARRYTALFRQASERLLTVQEDERRRIAGELHDGVGQVLTALTLTLDAATSAPRLDVARDHLLLARKLGGTALAETRDLAHRMRPARLEERGLVPALRDLASQSGFPVRVVASPASTDPHLLGPTATVEVFRIVQEALANAARHSGASQAVVSLACASDRLTIVISDEGKGFTRELLAAPGIGLAGMEERAAMLGGHLGVASEPDRGTQITVTLPTLASAGASA